MEAIIKLPEGYFPHEGFTICGRNVAGKNVYWLERNRPRALLRIEFVKGMKDPENLPEYFQECLDKRDKLCK